MPRYFFILGRNPELSLAELHALLPESYQPLACSKAVLVVEGKELDAETLMKRLGGTIKVGVLIARNPHHAAQRTIVDYLGQLGADKKIFLGLSAYALDDKMRLPTVRELRGLGMEIKRVLQAQGYKIRLVTSREIALSSVIVEKEKLLSQGAEIVLLYGKSNRQDKSLATSSYLLAPQSIGRTLAVQEFEAASARDFGRPEREMKVGLLPIQLAKIMINLARVPRDGTLLDPFCGFGTLLTEAVQMGHTNLIGSDTEQKMVDATHQNLRWLAQHNGIASKSSRQSERSLSAATPNIQLITIPVEELSTRLPPRAVDAIVTEPYLGPTKQGLGSRGQGLVTALETLYIKAFEQFAKVLKPSGRVVFIFPAFKSAGTLTKTSAHVLPEIKKLGFKPANLLPNPYSLTPIPSITYSRPDQKVLREIFVFDFRP